MKRISLLICCALILQILCSCSGKKDELEKPVKFYYMNQEITYNSSSGVIQAEEQEGAGFHNNLSAFLQAYLQGPYSEALYSLIPAEVYLISCSIDGTVAEVILSNQFSKLSGLKLTAACSAMLMSLNDYAGVSTLRIQAEGSKLEDKEEFVLNIDDIVLLDTSIANE